MNLMTDTRPADGAEIAQTLRDAARERILVLDGAMGTEIQALRLTEADFRGERFRTHGHDLRGNNDLLILTQPDAIRDIHLAYFRAGADVVETNTFSGTWIAQADYGLEAVVRELNRDGARRAPEAPRLPAPAARAREAAVLAEEADGRRRFVAGAVGPTNRTLSISPDVNNPGFRAVTFDQVRDAYAEQVRGLVDGGAELILIETIFDTLNAKAAVVAAHHVFAERGLALPIMISGTITDLSGRTLSGQTPAAFWHSLRHAQPLTFGLNCALGAREMRAHVQELSGL